MTKIKKSNYLKADLTLALLSLGFLISYPFQTSITGGLISSACSAGMIGGLADWFAVNALFRQPLGIRPGKIIRTEIIPRNRERIFTALEEMVQNDLLNKENLKIKLSQYDLSQLLSDYLSTPETQKKLLELLEFLIRNTIQHTDPLVLRNFLHSLLEECLTSFKLAPLLAGILEFSLSKNYVEPLADYLSTIVQEVVKHPQTTQLLTRFIDQAYEDYEGNNAARKLVATFLPSPAAAAGIVQEKLVDLLNGPQTQNALQSFLENLSQGLATDSVLQEKIELAKHGLLQKHIMQDFLQKYLSEAAWYILNNNQKLLSWLQSVMDNLLLSFKNSATQQNNLDRWIKSKLNYWIDKKHESIGKAVRNNLEKLNNETLVQLIENKAGNDLQMIRINGSLVGSLAGLLIYLLTQLIS
jgi:uncharacterized membrane-anchored protein YjiN (DUF445 family)